MSDDKAKFDYVISGVTNILKLLDVNVSYQSIEENVNDFCKRAPEKLHLETLDKQSVITELLLRFSTFIGKSISLENTKETHHQSWVNSEIKSKWKYWKRYKEFINPSLPTSVVESLDVETNKILDNIGDPNLKNPWDIRGLVVGQVQSGKTSNYTGLICKAADCGYKIIVVLAGLNNNLRSQTQVRLDEGFLGFIADDNLSYKKPVGVGLINSSIKTNYCTDRNENGDFNTKRASNGVEPANVTLFVVKKNKTILENLIEWLGKRLGENVAGTNERRIIDFPLLVVDDESDNASVDTGEQLFSDGTPNLDYDPKTINKLIRQLLKLFTHSSYVGYTATPCANVFIHYKGMTKNEGEDLFPTDFVNILPVPSDYIGPDLYFGEEKTYYKKHSLVHVEDSEQWLPKKQSANTKPKTQDLPKSLQNAVLSFIITCAVRKIRGQGNKHCSMLIHVTRFVEVQEKVYKQVELYFQKIKERLLRGIDDKAIVDSLKDLWVNDFVKSTKDFCKTYSSKINISNYEPSYSFEELLDTIKLSIEDIKLKLINGSANDTLDYKSHDNIGLKAIVVGGDKLSRGLTLEGLTVSYFLRVTTAGDSLMQMGRWFGYKFGYEDICRVYLPVSLEADFIESTKIINDVRQEFLVAEKIGLSPKEFSLKLKKRGISFTSAAKMKHTQEIDCDYQSSFPQTSSFMRSAQDIKANYDAFLKLTSNLEGNGHLIDTSRCETLKKAGSYLCWNNVAPKIVMDFLRNYHPSDRSYRSNPLALLQYIGEMKEKSELLSWNVIIVNASEKTESITIKNNLVIYPVKRTPLDVKDTDYISIKAVAVIGEEAVDLSDEQFNWAMEQSKQYQESNNPSEKPKDVPQGRFIRAIKGFGDEKLGIAPQPNVGTILLYVISPKKMGIDDISDYIVGYAISFPATKKASKGKFRANAVWMDNQ